MGDDPGLKTPALAACWNLRGALLYAPGDARDSWSDE